MVGIREADLLGAAELQTACAEASQPSTEHQIVNPEGVSMASRRHILVTLFVLRLTVCLPIYMMMAPMPVRGCTFHPCDKPLYRRSCTLVPAAERI
jgi:hypothetical protein